MTDASNVVQPELTTLLKSQVQCVLATLGEASAETAATAPDYLTSGPQQHLMAYAFSASHQRIIMMSYRHTRKVSNIQSRAAVSILWDNRTGQAQDHTKGWCLTAQGQAHLVEPSEATFEHLQQCFLSTNPNLIRLVEHPDSVLISITIEQFHLTLGYQQTLQLTW